MQRNTLYTVFGKYNGHFDTKVERFMRKMIVDDVVVGVAHIAMSWYRGAWQLWYMMQLMCDQQPSWYHRWSTNHWHTCLWSSLSAVPHDQLVFQFFVLQVFVSISPVVVSSWILHFCLFLNKLYKEVRPSQSLLWVSYIQYFVHQRRDENCMSMTSQAWWVFRNCFCMLYLVFCKYFKAIGDETRIMSKARCVIGGLWEPSRIIQPATKPSSDAISTLRKIDILYLVFFCRCNL